MSEENKNKFKEIEAKWQKWWGEHPELYRADDDVGVDSNIDPERIQGSARTKPKKYILNEFPYPSGSGLHVGHAFSFTGGDVYARFKRMQGYNVLFPMGFDEFGLPTENYAIKMKKRPQVVTKENTDFFRLQMDKLAFSFDWSREVHTSDPNYYKWTQWIFIKLFEAGLAYKKEMPINWCPSCKIGLANEEVVDSKCERCGSEVSRRNISQWVVKITDYADRLIDGLKETNFIDKVKQAQINWIGKSEGARIKFKIAENGRDVINHVSTKYLEVFTTRPDTLYGATFMVISPEHKLVSQLVETPNLASLQKKEIQDYVKQTRKKSEMERTDLNKDKTGVFSGLYAINPINNKKIPIWISDFVLASYGTGAIMSVPAHDDRDKEFAQKYNLPIINVYDDDNVGADFMSAQSGGRPPGSPVQKIINSPLWNGLNKNEAIKKAIEWVKENGIGEASNSYHLRDWIFSRQHYWGEPIPMIFCQECAKNKITNYELKITNEEERKKYYGWFTVPEEQLPIVLPEVEAYEPTDDGLSPLSRIPEFVNCKCPKCGGKAKRETDTMPNWAGSDWYFLRYCDSDNDIEIASQEKLNKWLPVDVYIGGDEHNTLHLLYSRFIHQFLYDLKVVPTPEPYYKRMSHGVILGPDNTRMSKSKGNVIVPESVADKYGVDIIRMYLMFMGPFTGTMAWNENTLMGVKRFNDRFTVLIEDIKKEIFTSKHFVVNEEKFPEFFVLLNKTIKKVENDLERFGYNTAIASMMELLNGIQDLRVKEVIEHPNGQEKRNYLVPSTESVKKIIKLIAPFAPYMAEEMWEVIGESQSVHQQSWPMVEEKYLIEESVIIPVAVNGKVRSQMSVDRSHLPAGEAGISEEQEIIKMAKQLPKIKKWLEDKKIVKEIYVKGKMVNLAVV